MNGSDRHRADRILFITLSCVGDAVMTTPVIEALHQRYPDAVIDIVGDKRSSQLFSYCPYRGEIIHKEKQKPLRGSLDLLRKLRSRVYDLIVDIRTDGLAYLLRGRKRLSKWNGRPYGLHAVEQFMGVIREIRGEQPIPKAHVWLSEEEENYARNTLSELPQGRWLALCPGSSGAQAEKAWPIDKYAALANALKDQFSAVILAGGPGEKPITSALGGQLSVPYADVTQTNLLQVAAILKRAAFFAGSDSGLGHVAAAAGTPTLTFFSVDRPERCLPWGGKAVWLMGSGRYVRDIPVAGAEARIRKFLEGND